jgi:hypothetical protein
MGISHFNLTLCGFSGDTRSSEVNSTNLAVLQMPAQSRHLLYMAMIPPLEVFCAGTMYPSLEYIQIPQKESQG